MSNFLFFKKKDRKRFIAVCPKKLEKCFLAICCEGCIELKSKSISNNNIVNSLSVKTFDS